MRPPRFLHRAAALVGTLALLVAALVFVVRPWSRSWGATSEEQTRVLPGDEIVPPPAGSYTRAITIHAPASVVFAWVAQTGQDRGGFYSYRLLENLVGCEMPMVDHLDPALQHWKVGDRLYMYPPNKAGGIGSVPVVVYERDSAIVFATSDDSTWGFVVDPIDEHTTRLLVRGRGATSAPFAALAFGVLAFEPMHFVMEKKMMITIASLSEGGRYTPVADDIAIATWAVTFGVFVASGVLALLGRRFREQLGSFAAAGVLFLALTYLQPPVAIAVALTLLLVVCTFFPRAFRSRWIDQPSAAAARA